MTCLYSVPLNTLDQNGYIVNDVTNVLLYNNPSRGYRKKLITMFYKYAESSKDRMETFENLVYAYYKHYKQINVKQKVKDECLVCLLDSLSKYDETHQDNILKVMDKKYILQAELHSIDKY